VIKNAKKSKPKFKVTDMTTQYLFNTSPLEKLVNRKLFTNGNKAEWLKGCWIWLEKESP
jgi:hypothetical protein